MKLSRTGAVLAILLSVVNATPKNDFQRVSSLGGFAVKGSVLRAQISFWRAPENSAAERREMVAHGASRGERVKTIKAPSGAVETAFPLGLLSPLRGSGLLPLKPTARAVGYLLTLLRSFRRVIKS